MSRRTQIAMTAEEVRAYIAQHMRVILVSNGLHGFSHAVPMNFAVDEAGRILMTSYKRAQKTLNLMRDPKATLLFESGEKYEDLKSVLIYATAEVIMDAPQVADAMLVIARKHSGHQITDDETKQRIMQSTKRAILRFTPVEYISWDHGKLGGVY